MSSLYRFFARTGKAIAAATGLRVRKAGPDNRFEAMRDALQLLQRRGYAPRVVIDGGANVGQWSTLASGVFTGAAFHLIEPQQTCHTQLRARFNPSRFAFYNVALTRPGVTSIRLASQGGAGVGTGAFVTKAAMPADVDVVECPAATLDSLFIDAVRHDDRALLKLDLEGHEIEAMRGATELLTRVEVLLSEVSFYDVYSTGHVLFDELLRFVGERGFVLYDVAALYPRPRDQRLRMADVLFVRRDSDLLKDVAWE